MEILIAGLHWIERARTQTRPADYGTQCCAFYSYSETAQHEVTIPGDSKEIRQHLEQHLQAGILTQQRRAELRIDASILSEGPEDQPIRTVQFGQANVSLHDLHLSV